MLFFLSWILKYQLIFVRNYMFYLSYNIYLISDNILQDLSTLRVINICKIIFFSSVNFEEGKPVIQIYLLNIKSKIYFYITYMLWVKVRTHGRLFVAQLFSLCCTLQFLWSWRAHKFFSLYCLLLEQLKSYIDVMSLYMCTYISLYSLLGKDEIVT